MRTKVLIVEDNLVIRTFYEKAISKLEFVELVGMASNGEEGLKLLHTENPDVIICDLNMPVMDGFEFIRRAMIEKPKPILIVSDLVQEENETNRYKALELGAIDILPKPKVGGSLELLLHDLESKIKTLKRVVVFSRGDIKDKNKSLSEVKSNNISWDQGKPGRYQIVAIGASTGGPQAYQTIFSNMDPTFTLPMVCAQHISEGFTKSLVSWLGSSSKLQIRLAEDGEVIQPGQIYFPPDRFHLTLKNNKIHLDSSQGEHKHKPSVNYLFESVADSFGSNCIGVLLTGMGSDGVSGLNKIYKLGGFTIAQDESSSIVYGMPKVANENGCVREVIGIDNLATRLIELGRVPK